MLDWRQLTKLKSTYTDALQAQINPETGRVHTSFSLTGAQTGRLSSNDPNLQNIPIRTEIGRKIRDAFIADPGHQFLSADYSQIELRLAAHMADVPQLKEAFQAGADIHAITAEELFGTVDRDTRNKAKTVNFAILYGISPGGWRGGSAFPRTKAKRSSTAISSASRGSAPTFTGRSASRASMALPGPCSAGRPISSRTFARPTPRSAAAPNARRSMPRSRAPAPI